MTRTHIHEEPFQVSPDELFRILHTPSAIRQWWGAARAIVEPKRNGIWMAAWGSDEDAPDYITSARMSTFDPPHRIVFSDYNYYSRDGALPFQVDFETTFEVTPHSQGALLRVEQAGFPAGEEADEFFDACGEGWRNTFEGIRRFIAGN